MGGETNERKPNRLAQKPNQKFGIKILLLMLNRTRSAAIHEDGGLKLLYVPTPTLPKTS
jgi:hypothetical protein